MTEGNSLPYYQHWGLDLITALRSIGVCHCEERWLPRFHGSGYFGPSLSNSVIRITNPNQVTKLMVARICPSTSRNRCKGKSRKTFLLFTWPWHIIFKNNLYVTVGWSQQETLITGTLKSARQWTCWKTNHVSVNKKQNYILIAKNKVTTFFHKAQHENTCLLDVLVLIIQMSSLK